jgi:hypothetical protein
LQVGQFSHLPLAGKDEFVLAAARLSRSFALPN